MKVIKIIRDDSITGIQYGIVDIPDKVQRPSKAYRAIQKIKRIQAARNLTIRAEKTKNK